MIKSKTCGQLDEIVMSEEPSSQYHWENFEQIVKIMSYCFVFSCNEHREYLQQLQKNVFSISVHKNFMSNFLAKVKSEFQANPWQCFKYFIYPEKQPLPSQDGQAKMIERYICKLLMFMIVQHDYVSYLQYSSNFIQQQTISMYNYDTWRSYLDKPDLSIIKKIIASFSVVSIETYQYNLERYELIGNDEQMIRYTKLKQDVFIVDRMVQAE